LVVTSATGSVLGEDQSVTDEGSESGEVLGDGEKEETVEGSGGWGKIKITMDGNQEIKKVEINDELLKDKVKLESAVLEAANDAIKKVQRVMAQKMSQFGGLSGL